MRASIVAALVLVGTPYAGEALATPESQIRSVLDRQAAAWSRGDLDAFCEVYADDATFVAPSGLTQGRQAVLERYRKKYVDHSGMGSLSLEIREIRMIDKSAASVVARWVLTWPDKPKAEGLTLLVLRQIHGAWRIVQDASM
jgi:uncharacterized protein (TIGR02246 family)